MRDFGFGDSGLKCSYAGLVILRGSVPMEMERVNWALIMFYLSNCFRSDDIPAFICAQDVDLAATSAAAAALEQEETETEVIWISIWI